MSSNNFSLSYLATSSFHILFFDSPSVGPTLFELYRLSGVSSLILTTSPLSLSAVSLLISLFSSLLSYPAALL